MTAMQATLTIRTLRLQLFLGWTAEERAQPQAIDVDIEWLFHEPPPACQTDELSDTLCYHRCVDTIKQFCEGQEFRLIEHFTARLSQNLVDQASQFASPTLISSLDRLIVTVHKPNPPVAGDLGAAVFRLEKKC